MLNTGEYFDTYVAALRRIDRAAVMRMAQLVFAAWSGRHTVFVCGNGGNAANAAHFVTDLVKLTAAPEGPRLRAVALGESFPFLTAAANDIAYEEVFAEQLRTFLSRHDLVIGLSTSGSSPNVLRAIRYANQAGAVTMGITGANGRELASCAQYPLVVASVSVQQIEDATMMVGHMVCLLVRDLIHASVGGRRGLSHDTPASEAADVWLEVQSPAVAPDSEEPAPTTR